MKLPPYGKQIRAHTNGIWICAGLNAWEQANTILSNFPERAALVWPTGSDPEKYHWPVSGEDVCVLLSSQQKPKDIMSIGRQLIFCGAKLVVILGETDNLPHRLTQFRPSRTITDGTY
ncbi:MAG: hypothetical protein KDI74_04935 [Gammaproteobacteria bacterium]|nr:hypothetical protein [Gammaproteobacteria bacterium]